MVTLKKFENSDLKKTTSITKMLLFSMGYFFSIFVMMGFNSFVWTFYEDNLGFVSTWDVSLWPIYMAVANVVYTIWSMVVGLLIGFYTDKPLKWTKKLGFHTPWIIIGGIPTIILFFLLFTPPQVTGIESIMPILLYYIIIVCLFDAFYSLMQTHTFGGFGAHFRSESERRKAGLISQIFTFIANFLTVGVWSLIITPGDPPSFTLAAFISIIILGISLLIFFPGSRESEEIKNRFIVGYEQSERISFFKTMKIVIKQKNFILVLFTYIFFMIAMGLISMNSVNFVDDVLQAVQEIRTIESLLMLISSLLTIPIWFMVARKIEHSTLFSLGLFIFGFIVLWNFFIVDIIQLFIVAFLRGIAIAMFLIMLSPLFADVYDEIAVKTQKHHQATLLGIRNFFLKISVTIQSFIVAIIHILTLYDPENPSTNGILGLRLIQGVLPFIFCIIGAIIFYIWYDLKGEKKQEIMQKLHEMGL
ncbi:MAG: MFS transporter [Promethearchaeota archaeon]|jgi:GPH family glycoside/pentoside/hexuronide:cation symporter